MICPPCRDRDHLACVSGDCTCGHAGTPVRALTGAERQAVRDGTLTAHVMPRETTQEMPDA
ncbi:hypothetical protein [Actinomadura rubrisoli]|uniref:Uncharacterized protein n=1 Tax=Actinomadura rubrisoli TaxID=2530368 RepID=A0A4V6PFA6_9ACTN|nr:hypothetical protein [Actinomadura rubrisoli]TDD97607.1 hypothetical protein E1298_00830 [Actinomadura rubrisoli]